MADRLAVMNEGRIMQLGTPDQVYEAPTCRFAAEFIGSTNLFTGVLAGDESRLFACEELPAPLQVQNPMNARKGLTAQLSVRPERIAMSHQPVAQEHNWAVGSVEQYAYMGSYTLFYVRVGSGRLMVVDVSRMALRAMERAPDYGDKVYLSWGSDCTVVVEQ